MIDILITLIMFAIICCIYFLPTIIAYKKEKKNKGAIFILNLLFGWTVILWGLALIWSFIED